jgi:hypothetical protein
MSKQPIPLGTLCSECAQYKGCTALCVQAEAYVNQDYIAQHDALFSDKGIILPTIQEDFTTLISSSRYKGRGGQHKRIGQFHSISKDK